MASIRAMKSYARHVTVSPNRPRSARSLVTRRLLAACAWSFVAPACGDGGSPGNDDTQVAATPGDGSASPTTTQPSPANTASQATASGSPSATAPVANPADNGTPKPGGSPSASTATTAPPGASSQPSATQSITPPPGPPASSAESTAMPSVTPAPSDTEGAVGGAPNVEPPSTGGMPEVGGGPGSDAGGAGPGSGDAPLFESDFEADAEGEMPDTSVWTNSLPTEYDSMGIVRVDASKAHSGSHSIYVKKGNDGQAFLQMQDGGIFPVSSGPIYVRAWMLTPEWPTSHVSWFEVGAVKNEQTEIRVGAHLGVLQVNQYPPDSDKRADGVTFAANEWHCIEYSYEQSSGSVHVWLDDAAVEGLTITGGDFNGTVSMPWPPIEAVRFGAEINTTEAWFDDIAISKTPIGCD